MRIDIEGEAFSEGQKIFVMGFGECAFIGNLGRDAEEELDRYSLNIFGDKEEHWSPYCFAIRDDGTRSRFWRMKRALIEVTYDPIVLYNRGEGSFIKPKENHETLFVDEGEELAKDWEGNGVDFPMIIEKWLLRLNGHHIPYSDYYKDPFNRWIDSLGS